MNPRREDWDYVFLYAYMVLASATSSSKFYQIEKLSSNKNSILFLLAHRKTLYLYMGVELGLESCIENT